MDGSFHRPVEGLVLLRHFRFEFAHPFLLGFVLVM